MKKSTIFSFLLFALITGISFSLSAQNLEVIEGPFWDSSNYVPPKPLNLGTKGSLPITHYQQCNQTWSSNSYGLGSCGSICGYGCAMSSVAMLLKLNGVNVNPGQLNTWAKSNSGYSGCSVVWSKLATYPGSTMSYNGSSYYSLSVIKTQIDAGSPVIVNVNGSYSCSHYVVVYGYSGSGNTASNFFVADPGSSTFPKNLSNFTICPQASPLKLFKNVYSPCQIPNGLYAYSITKNSAIVNWNNQNAISYNYYLKKSSSYTWSSLGNFNYKPIMLSNLNPNTSYNFKVSAYCQNMCTIESQILNFKTLSNKGDDILSYDSIYIQDASVYTGLNDFENENLIISPNPAYSGQKLFLKGIDGFKKISLLNINGFEIVKDFYIENESFVLPALNPSIYILKIETVDKNYLYKKLIIR